MAGASFFLVDGGLRLLTCVERGTFDWHVWTNDFWLLVPDAAWAGLGPNGKWFLRLLGGSAGGVVGYVIFRLANR